MSETKNGKITEIDDKFCFDDDEQYLRFTDDFYGKNKLKTDYGIQSDVAIFCANRDLTKLVNNKLLEVDDYDFVNKMRAIFHSSADNAESMKQMKMMITERQDKARKAKEEAKKKESAENAAQSTQKPRNNGNDEPLPKGVTFRGDSDEYSLLKYQGLIRC